MLADFVPVSAELALGEDGVKVTLALSKSSVANLKSEAPKHPEVVDCSTGVRKEGSSRELLYLLRNDLGMIFERSRSSCLPCSALMQKQS